MRLQTSAIAALASAAAAQPLSAWTSLCIHSQAGQIQELVACSDSTAFATCLNTLGETLAYEEVEACLAEAGCSDEMAAIGAETLVYECESVQEWSGEDLRRRAPGEYEASAPTQLVAAAAMQTPPAQPAITARQADDETTTSKKARPSDSDCYDTETTQERVCTLAPGEESHTCDDVDVEKKVCREGYLCVVDEKGGVACMVRVDKLDTAGIIVTIVFGSFIVIALGMMTYFCCKDRRDQKRLAAKAEAAAIAKSSGVLKKRNVSDRQPLMAAGPSSPGAGSYGGGEPPNPFNDQSRY